ncbi:type I polyketide synthase [Streptomyces sp. NBC_00704]|uniref:type I polyketide synthase n=1 Tax=Streptomyces sp. NBC_00704 TaxID=2975809 RepID=UPI002E2F8A06|nr:type I polyketide synthase [Streptomyces sp. NBC_00704]
MTGTDEKLVTALRASVKETERLRGRLRQVTADSREPIAIVSMACRYPGGVTSPEDLWRLVAEGRDAVSPFPTDRGWGDGGPLAPEGGAEGESYCREGGFLHDAGSFDPAFFSISPNEAHIMDPQQRLLLETSWEAFERAGIDPIALKGSRTGVFAGVMYHDYPYNAATGAIASGRISYVFGLEGPAVTVDTACSSSLVALHLAVQALRSGECSLALVGGVTVMATPDTFVEFSRQRGLAADGRCKSYAEAADGTGWSEGVGLLLVEKLSDARRLGHPVLAVVRGSAVNQDGASNGLTAPNGPSQQRVIRAALANARIGADQVDLVEGHGTGTRLGDPIEAQALLATYGQGREDQIPLYLGSLKSNLGHTQAAAGVAGVIKLVEAMRHGVMPRTLHVDAPSSQVDWSAGAVELLTEARDWPVVGDRPRRAAVSSFGISGTNAHVIIEQVPEEEAVSVPGTGRPVALTWSARTPQALTASAVRLSTWWSGREDVEVDEAASALTHGRAALEHRAVVLASSRAEALACLESFPSDAEGAGAAVTGRVSGGRTGWLFTGQGSQWLGMGRDLYAAEPVFAAAFDGVCDALDAHLPGPLREVVWGEDASSVDATVFTQAGLFAVQAGLVAVLRHWGVSPDVLLGHSVGEVSAAYAAGVFGLEDAARLVAARGSLMQALPEGGGMLALAAGLEGVGELIDGIAVDVAAVNAPRAVVVSGAVGDLEQVATRAAEAGVRATRLSVSHAFHSRLMDPMLEEFAQVAATVTYREPTTAVVSNVTGQVVSVELTDPGYWVRHVREAVRFADGLATARGLGVTRFVEVGPEAVLTALARQTLDEADELAFVPLMRRPKPEAPTAHALLLTAAAALYVSGVSVDWHLPVPARHLDLPTYPFQHRRFWQEPNVAGADPRQVGQTPTGHPLLGAAVAVAGTGSVVLTGRLSAEAQLWLADHDINGTIIFPGTGFVELAVRAGDEVGCTTLEELTLRTPLVIPASGGVRIQVSVAAADGSGRRAVGVYSRTDDGGDIGHSGHGGDSGDGGGGGGWTCHAEAVLSTADIPAAFDLAAWPPPGARPIPVEGGYERLAERGYRYGPTFRNLRAAWRRGTDVFAEVVLPDSADADGYGLHPALLDSALHIDLIAGDEEAEGQTFLPFTWTDVALHASGSRALRVRIERSEGRPASAVFVADESGQPVATIGSVASLPLAADHFSSAAPAPVADALFGVVWKPVTVGTRESSGPVHAVTPDGLAAADGPIVVCDCTPRDGDDVPAVTAAATGAALDAVQSWLADGRRTDGTLVVLTRGGMGPDGPHNPAAGAVWGLVRAAQAENPGRFVLADVDSPEDLDSAAWQAVVASGETELAHRMGAWLVPRMEKATPGRGVVWGGGTVLVTGGTGGLGALVARHLVACGVGSLVLVSRRGEGAPGAGELVGELLGAGAVRVRVVACDVSDRGALAGVVDGIGDLTGVVHAAGVADNGMVSGMSGDRLAGVLGAKADAAWYLHELTASLSLSAFVLFSSVGGSLLAGGQSAYAAANVFLDALAAHRHARGLPATSIGYGLWLNEGMGGALGEPDVQRLRRLGLPPLDPDTGLALFDAALGCDRPHVLATPVDRTALRARTDEIPALLRGLVPPVRRKASHSAAAAAPELAAELAGLEPEDRVRRLLALVRGHVATLLGHAGADDIEPGRPFSELGFDSLAAVELRNLLTSATGLRLPATLVFDHPNASAVAALLDELLAGPADEETAAAAVRTTAPTVDQDDPIVIVSMACRYPGGVTSPEDLWRLVADGVDAVGAFPTNRGWNLDDLFHPEPGLDGKSYTDRGSFLYDADQFDPVFFGISPNEAQIMDPQQRIFLEAAWESFERAGIAPASLKGSRTGVFAGVMYHDYGDLSSGGSVVSGRVSYSFGFEGPAVTVDTACSSSLVALHLAVQALRSGECTLALAGGVTVMATPAMFVEFSRQRGLSADGRCRSFAESADGTGWSEGVGLLLLERLSDARRQGHPVLAVVRGSAVNQDGASNGLTAPNGPSQQRVIRAALANARLAGDDVDLVEGHGTGTRLGDPIEAQALLATYGQRRDGQEPLYLGSLKSNLGHAQAAAGVGGVIKLVEAIRHGVMPRTLHVDAPSAQVDWQDGAVQLLTEARAWPELDRPRRAAVSSFGISGTNAHVIVEQAPEPVRAGDAPQAEGPVAVTLSARSPEALRASAARLASWWSRREDVEVGAVAAALAGGRALLEHRAVVVAADREEALAHLASFASEEIGAISGRVSSGRTGWLFTGQGSQWLGMGRELHDAEPVFAAAFDEACDALDAYLPGPLREVVWGEDASLVDATVFAQAGLFAVQAGLVAVLRHWGVSPDVLLGHSIGEISAAYAAGVFGLEDAARLVAARGSLMQALPEGGGMLALAAGLEGVGELISGIAVDIAAVNAPGAVVVSGAVADLERVAERAAEAGVRATRLSVSHAFHSRLMEPMLEEFAQVAASVTYREPTTAVVSNVTGQVVSAELTDPGYWVRHVREAVRFADGLSTARRLGVTRFVEVGPEAVLTALARQILDDADELTFVPLMRRPKEGISAQATLLNAAAVLHVSGVSVDWHLPAPVRHLDLPTYPFQRSRYWLSEPVSGSGAGRVSAGVGAAGLRESGHGLLAASVTTADGVSTVLTGRIGVGSHPWLADHAVAGVALVPGTALLDMALHAAEVTDYTEVGELIIAQPLILPAHGHVDVQVQVTTAGEQAELAIHSRPADDTDTPWTTHATGTLTRATTPPLPPAATEPEPWPPADATPLESDDLYVELLDQGYAYGPAFQGLRAAWRRGDDVYAEIALPEDVTADRHPIHPALLDAALHGLRFGVHGDRAPGSRPVLPFAWQGVRLFRTGARDLRVRLSARGAEAVHVEFSDEAGRPVGVVDSLVLREAPAAVARVSDTLFEVTWAPATVAPLAGADPVPVVSPAELDGVHHPVVVADCVPGAGPVPEAALELAVTALGAVQRWLDDPARAGGTLILVTRGAAGPEGDAPREVAAAPVWGLVRAAQSEHPGRFVLVDADEPRTVAADVWRRVASSGEPEWALRDGLWYQARIGRLAVPVPTSRSAADRASADDRAPAPTSAPALVLASTPAPAPAPDSASGSDSGRGVVWGGGTVLVTGGTGGLGALVARHLVACGVGSLVLVSRRGEGAPGAGELVGELLGAGAVRVRVVACDVSDRGALAGVVGGIGDLTGVVHAAGVADNGMVSGMSGDRLAGVLGAKADGAWFLHELTASLSLSAFVLFSSVGGSLLAGGQSAYAAANVFLDALAAHRHARGLPATSIAYALWQTETGLSQWLTDVDLQRMRRTGMPPLTEQEGLADLDAAVAAGRPAVLSMHLDLPALRRLPELPHPMLRALVPAPRAARQGGGPVRDAALRRRLRESSGAEQLAELRRLVVATVATVLGFDDEADVDPRRGFLESGFDSLAAIDLRNQLNKALGLQLPAMAVFDGQNPEQLAALVQAELAAGTAATATAGSGTAVTGVVGDDGEGGFGAESGPRDGARTGKTPEAGAGTAGGPEPAGDADSLSGLFREAVLAGKVGKAFSLLRSVAELRDSFDSEGMTTPLASARLGDGPGDPRIVCVSTPMAGGGLHQHARLASHLRGARPVSALALPGFATGEPLPASAEAVVRAMADNVLDSAQGRPFVLLGYSSGGLIAYATAHHLEQVHGVAPAGVVLLDSYRVQDEAMVVGMERLARSLLEVERTVGRYDSTRLSAMSRYFDILPDFKLDAVSAPVLFVSATGDFLDRAQYEGDPGDLSARPWDPDHELRAAPGSHFTLIQDDAETTAGVVEDWVGQL